jgi:hypothetical protein
VRIARWWLAEEKFALKKQPARFVPATSHGVSTVGALGSPLEGDRAMAGDSFRSP